MYSNSAISWLLAPVIIKHSTSRSLGVRIANSGGRALGFRGVETGGELIAFSNSLIQVECISYSHLELPGLNLVN